MSKNLTVACVLAIAILAGIGSSMDHSPGNPVVQNGKEGQTRIVVQKEEMKDGEYLLYAEPMREGMHVVHGSGGASGNNGDGTNGVVHGNLAKPGDVYYPVKEDKDGNIVLNKNGDPDGDSLVMLRQAPGQEVANKLGIRKTILDRERIEFDEKFAKLNQTSAIKAGPSKGISEIDYAKYLLSPAAVKVMIASAVTFTEITRLASTPFEHMIYAPPGRAEEREKQGKKLRYTVLEAIHVRGMPVTPNAIGHTEKPWMVLYDMDMPLQVTVKLDMKKVRSSADLPKTVEVYCERLDKKFTARLYNSARKVHKETQKLHVQYCFANPQYDDYLASVQPGEAVIVTLPKKK